MYDEKALNKLEETSYKELGKIAEKGELTPQTLSLAKELLSVLKEIPEVKGMHSIEPMESGGYGRYHDPRYYEIASYDTYSYDNGMSERRGRSPMTGRYVSRDDRMSGAYPMGSMSSGTQPDMASMMTQLMDRIDRLEKK